MSGKESQPMPVPVVQAGAGASTKSSNLIDYASAAAKLSLKLGTLRSMVHHEQIPFVRLGPRTVRFDPTDLDRWIAARKGQR